MSIETDFLKKYQIDVIRQAPIGIAIFTLPDFKVRMANTFYLQMIDRTDDSFIGQPLFEALPEVREVIEPLFAGVIESGMPYFGNEVQVSLKRYGKIQTAYFNLVYQPLRYKRESRWYHGSSHGDYAAC